MRNRSTTRTKALLFGLGAALLGAGPAGAVNYEWTFSGFCIFPGCGWSAPGNWSPNGVPDGGDSATIARSIRVVLTENIGQLHGLTLSHSARLHTRGYGLNVSASGASTFIWGTGVNNTGGNTRLVVDSGAYLGLDFLAYFLSMHQGAELRMNGGGAVATFGINVSASSVISGHGTVVLLNNGTKFDVAGHVWPSGGDLLLWSQVANRLDLDGNVGGDEPGQILVTADGNLRVQGSLADPFSGRLEIGNSNEVEFDTAVQIDGDVFFTSGIDNRLIGPSIMFLAGAEVTADGGVGVVEAPSSWLSGVKVDLLNPADELHLEGDASFASNTIWLGTGTLLNAPPGALTFADGSNVPLRLENQSVLEISETVGLVTLSELDPSGGELVFDIEGTDPGVDFDQLHMTGDVDLAGALSVRMPPSFTLMQGHAFRIIRVDGLSTGTFDGYAEGDLFGTFDGEELYITYTGGDGNDVVLYTVPEPGLAVGLALGIAGLAGALRRREGVPTAARNVV